MSPRESYARAVECGISSLVLILVCVDLSPITEQVVDVAISMAAKMNAELLLLHVGPPEPDFVGYDVGPQPVRDAVAENLRQQHRELETWRERALARGVAARALMVQGPTIEKVLSQSKRLSADFIVLGSHGHSALYDWVVGSVAKGVLHETRTPVVLVPTRPSDS